MYSKIMIGDKEIPVVADGVTPLLYKRLSGKDLFRQIGKLQKLKRPEYLNKTQEEIENMTQGEQEAYLQQLQEYNDELLENIDELPEIGNYLGFIMATQAIYSERNMIPVVSELTEEKMFKWLSQFESTDIMRASGSILAAYYSSMNATSKSKN